MACKRQALPGRGRKVFALARLNGRLIRAYHCPRFRFSNPSAFVPDGAPAVVLVALQASCAVAFLAIAAPAACACPAGFPATPHADRPNAWLEALPRILSSLIPAAAPSDPGPASSALSSPRPA